MSMMFRRRSREVPGLNTSSLPDLIFSVLFFFMIVTHMRHVTVKVKYQATGQGIDTLDQEVCRELYLYRSSYFCNG